MKRNESVWPMANTLPATRASGLSIYRTVREHLLGVSARDPACLELRVRQRVDDEFEDQHRHQPAWARRSTIRSTMGRSQVS